MSFYLKLINNVSNPKGFLGKFTLNMMNAGHTSVSKWGLSLLPKDKQFNNIADIGCGGGKNIERLLHMYPNAKVTGIDYSIESVAKSIRLNKQACLVNKAKVIQSDVSSLPIKDNSFDLICAFETIYFWPGPIKSYKEVYRTLKDNGTFLIVLEVTGDTEDAKKWESCIVGMKAYTEEELITDLSAIGFTDFKTYHKEGKDWFALLATK